MHDLINHDWHGASLLLLLRTLEDRIDLRRCVRSVQMDWYEDIDDFDDEDFEPVRDALLQFFSFCPSVWRLNIMTFPSEILLEIAPFVQITSLATSVHQLGIIHTVAKIFPELQNLFLKIDCVGVPFPPCLLHHRLKKLRLQQSSQITVQDCLFWALEVCAHITQELQIAHSGYDYDIARSPVPSKVTLSPSAGTNLRSLWLAGDELNFLANPNGSLAQVIQQLPSLQHLHVLRCLSFHAASFSVLPPSLRCLYLSEYGGWDGGNSSRDVFVAALSRCLTQALRQIEMVNVHGLTMMALEESQELGDLTPLKSVCKDRNIPFRIDVGFDTLWLSGEIRVLFA